MSSLQKLRPEIYFIAKPHEGATLHECVAHRATVMTQAYSAEETHFACALQVAARAEASLVNVNYCMHGLLHPERALVPALALPPLQGADCWIAPQVTHYLANSSPEQATALLQVPLTAPIATDALHGSPAWICVHSHYNPAEERRLLAGQEQRDAANAKERLRALREKRLGVTAHQENNPLQITMSMRVRQMVWWIVLAGGAYFLIENKGCGFL